MNSVVQLSDMILVRKYITHKTKQHDTVNKQCQIYSLQNQYCV